MERQPATALATFALALAAGTVAVAGNGWFGRGDLVAFAIHTIPFAALTPPAVGLAFAATLRCSVVVAVAAGFVSGLLFGYASAAAVALSVGRWFAALSVPVVPVWCGTASFVFAVALLARRTPPGPARMPAVAGLAAVSILAAVGFGPALALATGNQHLTIVILRHHPGDAELHMVDPFAGAEAAPRMVPDSGMALGDAEVALLRGTGLRGALEPRGSFASNTTGWPRATALVVFTGPLDAAVSLPQPRHGSIVYVQEAAGFRRVPADAPTFARPLRLLPGPDGLRFLVVHASGAVSGLDITP